MRAIATLVDMRRFVLIALLLAMSSAVAVVAHATRRPAPPRFEPVEPVHCIEYAEPPPPVEIETQTALELPAQMPAPCHAYITSMRALARCPQLPAESRRAIDDALDTTVQAWRDVPIEVYPQLVDACRQAHDAIVQAAANLPCPI